MWYICATEYYTDKIDDILPLLQHGWTECILLSETSQSEKHKYYMISLICGI